LTFKFLKSLSTGAADSCAPLCYSLRTISCPQACLPLIKMQIDFLRLVIAHWEQMLTMSLLGFSCSWVLLTYMSEYRMRVQDMGSRYGFKTCVWLKFSSYSPNNWSWGCVSGFGRVRNGYWRMLWSSMCGPKSWKSGMLLSQTVE